MGTAAIAYTIWKKYLKINPGNPSWPDRDRFVLSGGHGSMLLYSLLHLSGFDLPLQELKNFRQWGSLTPGHPEYGLTPGVETTTGPLGQGFANGVGMAIAEAHLAAEFNRPDLKIVGHFVYGIVTDGDLMEGVASEAASLAGHLKLEKIIYLYDDNRITIDGSTDLAFTEDRGKRFEAYGWQVIYVKDGNNVEEIDSAIKNAKNDPRPSLIICRTHIGFGLPTRQDTAKAHGEPPGEDELRGAKEKLGWPVEPEFYIPDDVLDHFREIKNNGEEVENAWQGLFKTYRKKYPDKAQEFNRRMAAELPTGWQQKLPQFSADTKGMATRASSGKVINAIASVLPELMGGSADLTPSNKTWIDGSEAFSVEHPEGRNFHFGVREHGMGSILNGINVHGGIIPFGGTFLVFSDYLRPALRVAALSKMQSIWIFTHDSIGLGEDGPTHQPVEHLAALRAIPNVVVIRPADANEVSIAWKIAVERHDGPTALILSRQNLPTFNREEVASEQLLERGAYVLKDFSAEKIDAILIASGSEVALILQAAEKLTEENIYARVVSFPSWELFAAQSEEYRQSVLPDTINKRLAVEAGVAQGWSRWIGDQGDTITINKFGASAPYEVVFQEYGFSVENVIEKTKKLVGK